ncbi:hypothetical protein [Pseudomonas tohonis]|uniref:hypothetical protein n=1 Tax=Pseudomonas tohonis TaxID=2725477 RepID=UPI0021DAE214|nr:hypothetical protein [Pseudomonas tohonis]UXY55358.1 hypothetical protein N9L84_12545 [Pseudomonas tohonis]
MTSRTVEERFDRVEEFTALLCAAEVVAHGDWDEQFTADLRDNFKRYGPHTYLSDSQLQQLERIAAQ